MENIKIFTLFHGKEKTKAVSNRNEIFSNIFNEYYKRIYNYTFYRINSKYDSEDITSQIFEKVIDKIDTYDEDKDSINQYATFDYKFPQSVPEGYEFKNAEYEKYKGVTDGEEWYMQTLELNYEDKTTGNTFSLTETYSEVPFTYVNNKKMEAIKVNDNDGVLYETGVISWVMDEVSYVISSEALDNDTKLQIAESIK